jgi:hypothetical protein
MSVVRMLTAFLIVSAFLITLTCVGCGGTDASSLESSPEASAHDPPEETSGRVLLLIAREVKGDGDEAVDQLANLQVDDGVEGPYRLFLITEQDFFDYATSVSEKEHIAFAQRVFDEMKELRVDLLNPAVTAAVERARTGDIEAANRALATLDRIASVNGRDGELEVARMVAIRLKEQVAEARAEIARLDG